MTTDFRALCAELVDYWENDCPVTLAEVMERARAALAHAGLSDLRAAAEQARQALEGWANHGDWVWPESALEQAKRNTTEALTALNAALAEPEPVAEESSVAQPADGEVAELVAWLRKTSSAAFMDGWPNEESINIDRAASLLERLSPPQPVPVSERLPGPELCWWYEPDEDDDGSGYGGSWTLLRIRGNTVSYTHWLPAHALPMPE